MTITLKIETGNAAFDDGNEAIEVASILRGAADTFEENGEVWPISLYDTNGNKVGHVSLRAGGRS